MYFAGVKSFLRVGPQYNLWSKMNEESYGTKMANSLGLLRRINIKREKYGNKICLVSQYALVSLVSQHYEEMLLNKGYKFPSGTDMDGLDECFEELMAVLHRFPCIIDETVSKEIAVKIGSVLKIEMWLAPLISKYEESLKRFGFSKGVGELVKMCIRENDDVFDVYCRKAIGRLNVSDRDAGEVLLWDVCHEGMLLMFQVGRRLRTLIKYVGDFIRLKRISFHEAKFLFLCGVCQICKGEDINLQGLI